MRVDVPLPGQLGLDGSEVAPEPEALFSLVQLPPPVPRGEYRGRCRKVLRRDGSECGRFVRADGMCDQPSRHAAVQPR